LLLQVSKKPLDHEIVLLVSTGYLRGWRNVTDKIAARHLKFIWRTPQSTSIVTLTCNVAKLGPGRPIRCRRRRPDDPRTPPGWSHNGRRGPRAKALADPADENLFRTGTTAGRNCASQLPLAARYPVSGARSPGGHHEGAAGDKRGSRLPDQCFSAVSSTSALDEAGSSDASASI
jgi:hypothetical protein